MARKKKYEHANHERWLVSYADFITLLFAFFVVLFASSQSDREKQMRMAAAMQAAFVKHGIFDPHTQTPALAPGSGANGKPMPLAMPSQMAEFERIKQEICDWYAMQRNRTLLAAGKLSLLNKTENKSDKPPFSFYMNRDGLVISLHDGGFFDSGSAEIRPSSLPLLNRIAAVLPPTRIRVEGHTDNIAIHSSEYRSNWELSTARATAIARILLQRGLVSPGSLSIAGYGEYHPVTSNATEEGRARNRRVDIVVLRDGVAPQAVAQMNATQTSSAQ